MKRLLLLSILLLFSACNATVPAGTYSISIHVPAPIVVQPPKATPLPTMTATVADSTPTQEASATIEPPFPTQAPDRFRIYETTGLLNVRTGAGVQYPVVVQLQPNTLVEADPTVFIESNDYTWFQIWNHADGTLLGWSANHRLQEFRG